MSMWAPFKPPVHHIRHRYYRFTLSQLRAIPPMYIDWIEVYVSDREAWVMLDRSVLDQMLVDKSWGSYDEESGALWNDLRVFIPEVDQSNTLDSLGRSFRALHLDEVIGLDNLWPDENLPEHLLYLRTYVDSVLQNSYLSRLPDFYVENVKVMGGEVMRICRAVSNKVIVFRPIAATDEIKVTVKSYLLISDGLQEYQVGLVPKFVEGVGATAEERIDRRENIFLGPISEPTYPSPMKILLWNCRGARNTVFWRNFNDLIAYHKPSLAIITERIVTPEEATRIVDTNMHFDCAAKVDVVSNSGGIWMLWTSTKLQVGEHSTNDHDISVVFKAVHEPILGATSEA